MTTVIDLFTSLLPPRTKSSPTGWISFNAPCCIHKGHKADTKKRGGVRFDGGIVYNCFNCKYSAGWKPGSLISEKLKTLCRWMGADDTYINNMMFAALKTESPDYKEPQQQTKIEFPEKPLPPESKKLSDWATESISPELELKLVDIYGYLLSRGIDPIAGDFYWSPTPGYIDRVIIPFRYNGRIVGNSARRITPGKLKYLSEQSPYFVFNFDVQKENQKYIIVTEGPFDALAVNGVALLTNEISEQQARIINSIGAEVIVVPDQDKAGLRIFDQAAELNWSVASPTWDDDVKDCADAAIKYGKLFVVVDAILTAQKGAIKINMAKKKLEHKLARATQE